MNQTDPISSIVTVGDGRGFVVEASIVQLMHDFKTREWRSLKRSQSYIITAAHCLPHLPPCHGASYVQERTYPNLVGPLGEAPTVAVECLFVNPVADIAVLGKPDDVGLADLQPRPHRCDRRGLHR